MKLYRTISYENYVLMKSSMYVKVEDVSNPQNQGRLAAILVIISLLHLDIRYLDIRPQAPLGSM